MKYGSILETSAYCFSLLWESIHGPNAWDVNPWVWVIKFKKLEAWNG